jgi:hypothetical protein
MPARERKISHDFQWRPKRKDRKMAYCVGLLPQAEVARKQNGTDQPTVPSSTVQRPSIAAGIAIFIFKRV